MHYRSIQSERIGPINTQRDFRAQIPWLWRRGCSLPFILPLWIMWQFRYHISCIFDSTFHMSCKKSHISWQWHGGLKGWWPSFPPQPGSCYQNIPITSQKERRQCSPHSLRVLEGLMPDPLFSSLNVAAVQCCPIPTSPIQSVSWGKPSPKSKIWDSVWKGALTNINQVSEKKISPGWSLRVGVLENPLTNCQMW